MNQTIDKDERSWFDRGYPGITAIYGSTYQHDRKKPEPDKPKNAKSKKKVLERGKYKYTLIDLYGEKVFSGSNREVGSYLGVHYQSVTAAYLRKKPIRKVFRLNRTLIRTIKPKNGKKVKP